MLRRTLLGSPVTIEGPGGNRIACQVAGPPDAPPVILTSGIGCGPVFYTFIGPELARRYRTIFWDYRAHGDSELSRDRKAYRVVDHAGDLEAVVRTLTDRPPLMVAFSMGVQVTLEWIKRYDTSGIPGYVFLLGMPLNPLHNSWFWGSKTMRRTLNGLLNVGGDRVVHRLHPLSKAVLRTRFSYAVALKMGLVTPDFSWRDYYEFICYSSGVRPDAYLRTAVGVLEHDATAVWDKLETPTLFIAADGDMLVPARDCEGFSGGLTAGRYEELAGRSHAGTVEEGQRLARKIGEFVDARFHDE